VTPSGSHPDKKRQNWLMNHRSYDAQRFSPLTRINKDNVKSLKLAYRSRPRHVGRENCRPRRWSRTVHVTSSTCGHLYKIDVRSGDAAASSGAWTPSRSASRFQPRRCAVGNFVISTANIRRAYRHARDTGQMVWETNLADQPDVQLTAAPLVVKDKIIWAVPGRPPACATGSPGRRQDRQVLWQNTDPKPGEPGSETGRTRTEGLADRRAHVGDRQLRRCQQQRYLGYRQSVPMFDAYNRPGDKSTPTA